MLYLFREMKNKKSGKPLLKRCKITIRLRKSKGKFYPFNIRTFAALFLNLYGPEWAL